MYALAQCDPFTLWFRVPCAPARSISGLEHMYDRRPEFFREDTPPGRQVEAKIKWFNASKGFGFVTMSDGSQDAFLPMAILRRAGHEDVREGASITCEVSAGAKGPLVTNVLNIKTPPPAPRGTAPAGRPPQRPATVMDGAVK